MIARKLCAILVKNRMGGRAGATRIEIIRPNSSSDKRDRLQPGRTQNGFGEVYAEEARRVGRERPEHGRRDSPIQSTHPLFLQQGPERQQTGGKGAKTQTHPRTAKTEKTEKTEKRFVSCVRQTILAYDGGCS